MRTILKDLMRRRWWLSLLGVGFMALGLLISLNRFGRFVMLIETLCIGVFYGMTIGALEHYSGVNRAYATLPVPKRKVTRLAWIEIVLFPALLAPLFLIISLASSRTSWAVWPDGAALFCAALFSAGFTAAGLLVMPPHKQSDGFSRQQLRALVLIIAGLAYLWLIVLFLPSFGKVRHVPPSPVSPWIAWTIGSVVSAILVVVSYFRFGLPVHRRSWHAGPLWRRRGAPRFILAGPWAWLHLIWEPISVGVLFVFIAPIVLRLIDYPMPGTLTYLLQLPLCHWGLSVGLAGACIAGFAPLARSMRALRSLPISSGRLALVSVSMPCVVYASMFAAVISSTITLGLWDLIPPYASPALFALAIGVLLNGMILVFYSPVVLMASLFSIGIGTFLLFTKPVGGDLQDGPLVGGIGTPAFWICSVLVVVSLAVSLFVLRRAIERRGALYRRRSGPGWNIEIGN